MPTANPDHGKALIQALLDARLGRADASSIGEAVLRMGSETPDNLACAARLDYGAVQARSHRTPKRALKLRGKDVRWSEALHALEDMSMPREVQQACPEMDEDDWYAVTRLCTMVFLALESNESMAEQSGDSHGGGEG